MVKWDPGPKKLEKGSPNTQTKLRLFPKKTLFFSESFFSWFYAVFWGGLFVILMAKVPEMRGHWEHFSRHFAAKLESWNVWFRVHQTLLFMVSRGRVWECWASFFKWFSELDPGMYFFDFLWDLGSNREPKWWLLDTISAINWRSIFWWFLEGSADTTNCWNASPGKLFEAT